MGRDAGYPSNLLNQDQLNSLYGGEGARNFGGPAWDFIHGWVRDIANRVLTHVRQDIDFQAPLVQAAMVVGDCIGVDLSRATSSGGAWIDKMSNIAAGNAVFLGIAADNVTAGLRCKMAAHGPIPANLSLLSPSSVSAGKVQISVNSTTNRLQVANVGDDVVGYSDPKGNVMLFAPGRVATLV